ncbi:DUF1848 family protein [Moorellaceae bacterium AZ2]
MSRRTDMAWFPEQFCRILLEKHPPETVHTVVVWTKFPEALLRNPYREVLSRYDQVYVHLTITGLGGTELEPRVPECEKALAALPELIEFVGSPERVRVRPDPLIRVRKGNKTLDNLERAKEIIRAALACGVRTFSTSFCTRYPKVINRLSRHGYLFLEYTREEQLRFYETLKEVARPGVVYACCIPGAPVSKCIDGELLARLHPRGEKCNFARAKQQRELCGCTTSIDIGWYDMHCKSGCLYCYANPE